MNIRYRSILIALIALIAFVIMIPAMGDTPLFAASAAPNPASYSLSVTPASLSPTNCSNKNGTSWTCDVTLSVTPLPGKNVVITWIGPNGTSGILTRAQSSARVSITNISCTPSSMSFTFSGTTNDFSSVTPATATWTCSLTPTSTPTTPPSPTPTHTNTPTPGMTPSATPNATPTFGPTAATTPGTPPANLTPTSIVAPTQVSGTTPGGGGDGNKPNGGGASSVGSNGFFTGIGLVLGVLAFLLYLLPKRQTTFTGRVLSLILPVSLLKRFDLW